MADAIGTQSIGTNETFIANAQNVIYAALVSGNTDIYTFNPINYTFNTKGCNLLFLYINGYFQNTYSAFSSSHQTWIYMPSIVNDKNYEVGMGAHFTKSSATSLKFDRYTYWYCNITAVLFNI